MKKYTRVVTMSPVFLCFCLFLGISNAHANIHFSNSLVDTINVKITGDFFICEKDTNQLSVSSDYDEVLWSVVGSSGNIITTDLTMSTIEIDAPGTYKVSVKDQVDGQVLTGEAEIEVQLSKVFGGISPSTRKELCVGESVDLIAFGGAQTFNAYGWAEPLNDNSKVVTVSPTETTTYKLQVENENSCVASYEYEVVVNPNPEASFIEYNVDVCEKSPVQIGVTTNDQYSYHWNTGDNTSSINKVVRENEVYKVTVSNQYNCVTKLETEEFQVKKLDPLKLNAAEKVFSVNSTVNFSVGGISNADCFDSFVWSIDGTVVADQTNSSAPLTFNGTNNKQTVCVKPQASTSCPCEYEEICTEVFVINEGDCAGTINQELYETCIDGSVILEGDSQPGASSIFESSSWKLNGVVVNESSNTADYKVTDYIGENEKSSSLELTMKKAGTYNVTWTFSYQGCTNTREAVIRVIANPDVDVAFDSSKGCMGEDFDFFVNTSKNDFNYSLTYLTNDQQSTTKLTSGSPNAFSYGFVDEEKLTLKLIQLKDEDSGCLVIFTDADKKEYSKEFYKPLNVQVDTVCNEDKGIYYTDITVSDGSGEYEFVGEGTSTSNSFQTENIIEGNGTLVEVNDENCPNFNQKVESYVTCSCVDVPIEFEIGNYEGCVGGSIFVPIQVGPTFSKGQDNVLFYEIHSTKGSTDTLVTGVIDLSDCDNYEDCEVEIPYDPALLVDQTYNLISYISKYVAGTDSIDRGYTCFNYYTAKEKPVDLKFVNVQTLEVNTYKDTVCLNQKNQVYGVENVPFKYAIDWSSESSGVSYENISPYHISASFTESGNKQIKMIQKFSSGKGSVCEEEQVIDVYVRDEVAPELVDISLVPGNIFVAETNDYDCFQWGYINMSNGDIVEGANTKFWILSNINTDNFAYYVDVWKCGSECKSRTYFDRDKPFVFVTGSKEVSKGTEYKVYPNPTRSDVMIEGVTNGNESKVSLVNSLGQRTEVSTQILQDGRIVAKISELNISGLHYLIVENDQQEVLFTKAIIIK